MIKTFLEFQEVCKNSNYTFSSDDLSEDEKQNLQLVVSKWSDAELTPAINALNDYYCIKVPNAFLVEVFSNHLDLALENFTNGISDTCQRDILIDSLLPVIGIDMPWPMYMHGEKTIDKFKTVLKNQLAKVGGKFLDTDE